VLLNQIGIAHRRAGRFDAARAAYESAMALDPGAIAPRLNLAILFDLYLGENARALVLYQRCQELAPAEAATLGKWTAELKARKPTPASPAAVDAPATVAATGATSTRKETP
jgi:Flp pilus assembly protein TadD